MGEVSARLSVDLPDGEPLFIEQDLEAEIFAALERQRRSGLRLIGRALESAGGFARPLSCCRVPEAA